MNAMVMTRVWESRLVVWFHAFCGILDTIHYTCRLVGNTTYGLRRLAILLQNKISASLQTYHFMGILKQLSGINNNLRQNTQ